MTTQTDNPYQPPQVASDAPSSSGKSSDGNWKLILRRWERLRLLYNLIVGVFGLLALSLIPFDPFAIVGAVMYGLGANMMYFFGPISELYLNWLVDAWEDRFVPQWVTRFVWSPHFGTLLFAAGTLFSMALTAVIGLAGAFSVALQGF